MDLKVNNISFSYNSKEVLSNINFEFMRGHITGIIGPNGSGKTTLLKCINNILKPLKGVVNLNGESIKNLDRKSIARLIGFVPQNEYINFPFSVYDILLMGRYPRLKMFSNLDERDYTVIDDIIELLDIHKYKNRRIDELSGGEFQKIIIARALVQEPEILLLDEPTLHLDLSHQFEILNLMSKIVSQRNLIVIMVTHDLFLAGKYCKEILVMNEGKIVISGKIRDVLTRKIIRDVYKIEADIIEGATDSLIIIPRDNI